MRWVMVLLLAFALLGSLRAIGGDPHRRLQRIPPPERPEPAEPAAETPRSAPTLKPAAPTVAPPRPNRPNLLEPQQVFTGSGSDVVASFRAPRNRALAWELAVREQHGPVVQILGEDGPAPARIAWDGRLIDGTQAWAGMIYVYDLALMDSTGAIERIAGEPFTLPSYTREDGRSITILMSGRDLSPGRRTAPGRGRDPVAAATARLERSAERLGRVDGPILVEVLAPEQDTALRLAAAIQTALVGLLDLGDRPIEAFAGVAADAPIEGTVLIETEAWPGP